MRDGFSNRLKTKTPGFSVNDVGMRPVECLCHPSKDVTQSLPFGPAACLMVKSSRETDANLPIFLVAFSMWLKLMQARQVLCKPYPPPLLPTE